MLIYKYLVDQQTNHPKGTSRFQTTQQDFTNLKHNLLNTTVLNVFWSDDRLSSLTLTFTLIFFFCLTPESLAQGSSRPKVTTSRPEGVPGPVSALLTLQVQKASTLCPSTVKTVQLLEAGIQSRPSGQRSVLLKDFAFFCSGGN